jgi:DNA recombination-dependent growth factor C
MTLKELIKQYLNVRNNYLESLHRKPNSDRKELDKLRSQIIDNLGERYYQLDENTVLYIHTDTINVSAYNYFTTMDKYQGE